jgi:hypothetical protein
MKQLLIICALFLSLLKTSQAQYVLYQYDTLSLYRPAADPRYSDYKTVSFDITIPPGLADSLLKPSLRNNAISRKEFVRSIEKELSNAGLTVTPDSLTDLKITYTPDLNGSLLEKVTDKAKTPQFEDTIPNIPHIYTYKPVNNAFLQNLDGPAATATYKTIVRNLIYWAYYRRQSFVADFYDTPIELASITNIKKYPKLKSLDSLNKKLFDTLLLKTTKDYTAIIKPFEQGYKNLLPGSSGMSEAKVAIYSNLAFLYYLAIDTTRMNYALDSLYAYSADLYGERVDYDKRVPLEQEIDDLVKLQSKPKIPLPGAPAPVPAFNDYIVRTINDTIKGNIIDMTYGCNGIYVPGTIVIELRNDQGELVRRNIAVEQVKSLSREGTYFEVFKLQYSFWQTNVVDGNWYRPQSYIMQVIYATDKIKILDAPAYYGDNFVIIRPGETQAVNLGRAGDNKKNKILKKYFKDSAPMLDKLTTKKYTLETMESFIELANDYTNTFRQ